MPLELLGQTLGGDCEDDICEHQDDRYDLYIPEACHESSDSARQHKDVDECKRSEAGCPGSTRRPAGLAVKQDALYFRGRELTRAISGIIAKLARTTSLFMSL